MSVVIEDVNGVTVEAVARSIQEVGLAEDDAAVFQLIPGGVTVEGSMWVAIARKNQGSQAS